MEINRETLKALASESRLDILKALADRRKMPAELAKQLGLSGSTVSEHLNVLEKAGLIKRIETGHKWIYYELTDKGVGLARPKLPVQFVLMLSLGIVLIFGGFARYVTYVGVGRTFAAAQMVPGETAGTTVSAVTVDWILISLLSAGLILLVVGLVFILRSRLAWLR
jgi:DNA-binding transcriptional ArsR family regulator